MAVRVKIMETLEGVVVSVKMLKTAVVKVVRRTSHPLYKKLLKRSKKYKVDTTGLEVTVGDWVRISKTRPISKEKHFKIVEKIATTENTEKISSKTVVAKKVVARRKK